jgi:6-phosphogluconolactonase/glucosamine-6-phosphate isomerase/deaminase
MENIDQITVAKLAMATGHTMLNMIQKLINDSGAKHKEKS